MKSVNPSYKMYMLRAEVLKALGRGREAVLSYAECCEKFLPVNKQKKCSLLACAITLAVQNNCTQFLFSLKNHEWSSTCSDLVKHLVKENKSDPKLLATCLSVFFNKANFNFDTSCVPLSLILLHVNCSFLDTLFQHGTLVTKQDVLNAVSQLEEQQVPILSKLLSEYRSKMKETVDYTELCVKALDPSCPKPKFINLFIKCGAKPPLADVMQVMKPDELREDACRYFWMNGDEQIRSKLIKDLVIVDKVSNMSWLTLEDLAKAIPESHFQRERDQSECVSEGDEEQENDGDIPPKEVLAEAIDECDLQVTPTNSSEKFCVDLSKLDGLPWEVECTVKFFKCLKNDKLPLHLRQAIINRLYRLATGERSSKLSKEVGGGEEGGLLFECKLTKSARIIWEEAKQFSPRLTRGSSTLVFSEVIRVWDVAWNHDRLHHCIQNVKLSRKKSAESDIQFSLSKSTVVNQTKYVKCPRQFLLSSETSEVCDRFVPAANIDEHEYSVVSFYSVTSALVSSALADGNKRKDFPYKEWPKEHTIISLPQNRESILLLGRSGTGKTTCCLFRMWNQFRNFWESTACSESSFDSSDPTLLNSGEELTLHQVFISKNQRLCDCLKDKFYNMVASYKFLEPQMKFCKGEVPIHLNTVHEYAYPLFLSSRQFLILLDFSISAKPFFFPRRPDGSLKILVVTHRNSIESVAAQSTEIMAEVTAECFRQKVWPKIAAVQQRSLDPLLVWMEIKSFIKGSHEAIRTADGYLSLPLYESLGSKMAPNFKGDRKEIYHLFIEYQRYSRKHCLFDECDLLHNLYQRLNKLDRLPMWSIDHFFVDEVQDFTQAELAILIRCCQNPNGLFMTGDTAQNIMSGVSFRFCDLRSLFHCMHNDQKKGEVYSRIKISVPEIHHLDINFRSHSGVLKLAASIIELMKRFFPLSFDVLPEDHGLFPGPQPIFIDSPESASLENDLENFLKSCERQSSGIQFGANQAIIVRSENVKDSLQDKAIVLTVFESKGLEFDDVLLFNFFKDSDVDEKKWRVVTSHANTVLPDSKGLEDAPRPVEFDEQLHKSLVAEFKCLYTAITRARCNLWIYDSDTSKHSPIVDYWARKGLVKVLEPKEGENVQEWVINSSSTPKQWLQSGNYMKSHGLLRQALICYKKANAAAPYLETEANLIATQGTKAATLKAAEKLLMCDIAEHRMQYLEKVVELLRKAGNAQLADELENKLN